MSLSVITTLLDGSMPVQLGSLGMVGSIRYASEWPYGCTTFGCTLDVPEDFSHPGLRPGRRLHVYDGVQRVWTGVLGDPQRGAAWQITGRGLASLASGYAAIADTTPTSSAAALNSNPNTVVDAAIARGLPWIRDTSLPAAPGGVQQSLETVTAVLDSATSAASQRWAVNADGRVISAPDPISPRYVVIAADTPGGRSIDRFVTDLYGIYLASGVMRVASVAATTVGPAFGRVEKVIDLTDLGPLTAGQAQSILAAKLALMNIDPTFTGSLTVQSGALLDLGGVPAALSTIAAGVMVELRGSSQDPGLGNLNFTTRVRIIAGECEYDADSDLLRLTPVGALRRDLVNVLAGE